MSSTCVTSNKFAAKLGRRHPHHATRSYGGAENAGVENVGAIRDESRKKTSIKYPV